MPQPNRLWQPPTQRQQVTTINETQVQFIKNAEDELPLFYFA